MLCSNRFPLSGAPSTCALDVGIVPLPSILLFIVFPIYVAFVYRVRGQRSKKFEDQLAKWIHITYLVLVVCLFAMHVLEIARLVAANMGVGLLPFGIIANMIVFFMLAFNGLDKLDLGTGRARDMVVSVVVGLYWFFMAIVTIVKVARLTSLEHVHSAKGTPYPTSDWLLDNGTMLALYIVFLGVESAHLYLLTRKSRGAGGAYGRFDGNLVTISKPKLQGPIVTV